MTFFKHPKYNRSTFFVLPAIDFPKNKFKKLINTYLFCPELVDNDIPHLFLHMKKDLKVQRAIQLYNTVTTIHSLNESEVVIAINIEEDLHEDIRRFINGEYSKFSKRYKERIKKYFVMYSFDYEQERFEHTHTFKILYPTDEERSLWKYALSANNSLEDFKEIYSIPNREEETFKLNINESN